MMNRIKVFLILLLATFASPALAAKLPGGWPVQIVGESSISLCNSFRIKGCDKWKLQMGNTGRAFRALHEQTGTFVIPNPWDVGSASILTVMGFKALATTSSGMAFVLGLPDGAVPPELVLKHCGEIVAATSLSVSADLERGFGDSPESVAETIAAAVAVGLAGCSIEDYTGNRDAPIYDKTLAIERIQAASEHCRRLSDDFVLTARCENLLWGRSDLDEVIAMLQAYAAAGADVLYAPGLHSLDTIREVCAAVNKPVNVVIEMPGKPFSVADLERVGVKRISVGAVLARLAYGSLVNSAREMLGTGTFQFAEKAINYNELEDLFRQQSTRPS